MAESSIPDRCPKCGTPLDAADMGGLCPKCVAADFLKPGRFDAEAETDDPLGLQFDDTSPRRFGDYELIEEIARGGMGVVFRARQLRLGREVAVKFLLDGILAGDTAIARFLQEAESAAALHHPNIVAIHEVGEAHGRHFFSMEFVRGRTLAELVQQGPLGAKRAAAYLAKIADAVHYAHGQGVLHRDLKPSNVLVDERDEPRVTDFGLAKRDGVVDGLTLSGQVLGTPSYIPPEQAGAGGASSVDARSDVYSLGAVLYHLLTGRPPFTGDSATAVLRQVAESDPVAPRLLNPSVPRDIETVCLHCLAKEPSQRYASAGELGAELRRFLRDEPVSARPAGPLKRGLRWCRRRPALAAAWIVIVLLAVAIVATSAHSARRMDGLRRQSLTNLYASDLRLAQQAIADGYFGAASELLDRHVPAAGDPDLRNFEWHHFKSLCVSDEVATLGTHPVQVQRIVFSEDGGLLFSASSRILSWELATRRPLPVLEVGNFAWALAPSRDGHEVLAARHSGSLLRFDASSGRLLSESTNRSGFALALAWPPTQTNPIAISGTAFERWSLGEAPPEPIGPVPQGTARAFVAADASWAALLVLPKLASIWRFDPLREIARVPLPAQCRALSYLPQSNLVLVGDFSGQIHVIDPTGTVPMRSFAAHRGIIECLAVSRDGTRLASAGADQILRVWDTSTWSAVAQLHGHKSFVFALAFSPDGRWLASGDRLGVVKLWDASGRTRAPAVQHGTMGFVADDGSCLAIPGGARVELRFTGMPPSEPEIVTNVPGALIAVSGSGLVAISPEGRPSAYSRETGWRPLALPQRLVQGVVALSPTSRYLAATLDQDRNGGVWDLQASRLLVPINGRRIWISPTFSADESLLAHGQLDGAVRLFELPSGRLRGEIRAHLGFSYACVFSRDSRYLATAGFDGTVRLWNAETLIQEAEFHSTADAYWCVAMSPDGRRIAAGTGDSAIVVWDVASRLEVAHFRLPGPLHPVEGTLRFTPDGRSLIRGGAGYDVWVGQ